MWYSEIAPVLEERWAALRVEMSGFARRLSEEDGTETVPVFSTAYGEQSGMRNPSREEMALAARFGEASGWPVSQDVESLGDEAFRLVANGVFRTFAEGTVKGWEQAEVDRQWEIWQRLGGYGDQAKEQLERGEDGIVRME